MGYQWQSLTEIKLETLHQEYLDQGTYLCCQCMWIDWKNQRECGGIS
jgi:hypothetical protein